MTKRAERILAILAILLIIVGFVNFSAFLGVSRHLGGDALNGYERDGHFYVSSKGVDTEVPEETWRLNRLHGQTTILTHLLAMLSIGYLLFRYIFPAVMFGGNYAKRREERLKAVEEVRASGPPLASVSRGGRVGGVYVSGPLIEADVHPAGLVVSTVFSSPCAIRAEEVKQVLYRQGIWNRGVEITHRSRDVSGSVALGGVSMDSHFAQVLNRIVGQERVRASK